MTVSENENPEIAPAHSPSATSEQRSGADAVDPEIEDLDATAAELENVVGGGTLPANILVDVMQNKQKGARKGDEGMDALIRQ